MMDPPSNTGSYFFGDLTEQAALKVLCLVIRSPLKHSGAAGQGVLGLPTMVPAA